jgi:hypothetical protein
MPRMCRGRRRRRREAAALARAGRGDRYPARTATPTTSRGDVGRPAPPRLPAPTGALALRGRDVRRRRRAARPDLSSRTTARASARTRSPTGSYARSSAHGPTRSSSPSSAASTISPTRWTRSSVRCRDRYGGARAPSSSCGSTQPGFRRATTIQSKTFPHESQMKSWRRSSQRSARRWHEWQRGARRGVMERRYRTRRTANPGVPGRLLGGILELPAGVPRESRTR